MATKLQEPFAGNYDRWSKDIDVDHGLWTELQTRKVLTTHELSDCKSCGCDC